MKKIIVLSLSFLFFFTLNCQLVTKPSWFSKHTITNTTPYTVLLFARIPGYNNTHGNDFGMAIEAHSDSNAKNTGFFEALPVGPDATFTVIGPITSSENYIFPSEPIVPDERDYKVVIQNGQFALQ